MNEQCGLPNVNLLLIIGSRAFFLLPKVYKNKKFVICFFAEKAPTNRYILISPIKNSSILNKENR